MTVLSNSVGILQSVNRAGVDFLKLDLEVGLTFSHMALETQDSEKRARTRRAARRAYDTVLKLSEKVPLTNQDAESLARNLLRLKCDLALLGEVL